MEKHAINEGNKLIALFISEEPKVLENDLKRAGTVESLHYHDSFEWIMKAVQKITDMTGYRFLTTNVESYWFESYDTHYRVKPEGQMFGGYSDVKNLFEATVAFLNWYIDR